MRLSTARAILSLVWVVLGLILFSLFAWQDILGWFGSDSRVALDWLVPKIIPFLSLIVTTWVVAAMSQSRNANVHIGSVLFVLTVSLFYFLLLGSPVLYDPLTELKAIEILNKVDKWIVELEGLMGLALGVFFGNENSHDSTLPDDGDNTPS